jgi:hypothetical protein
MKGWSFLGLGSWDGFSFYELGYRDDYSLIAYKLLFQPIEDEV